MHRLTTHPAPSVSRVRSFVLLLLALGLVVSGLVVATPGGARAQEQVDCEVVDLGTLGNEDGSELRVEGRWTTEDCDSVFRAGSDAHTYRFSIERGGRIRIDLASAEADSHLALFDGDGNSIAGDDDTGSGVDSRIERDLEEGAYLIEAATIGGRVRGPADFVLTVQRVAGCEAVDLGTLQPGTDLTAAGQWTPADCGGRLFEHHPAHSYRFELSADGRVRIDLTSPGATRSTYLSDPFLTLLSTEGVLVDRDDDGGTGRNSQLELHLSAGTYIVEATTYRSRDLLPATTDFELAISLLGHDEFSLKVENLHVPSRVVANEPFAVHYRVGNVGGGDLPHGMSARLFVVAPGVLEQVDPILASEDRWQASDSYHSGAPAASGTSVAIEEVAPFEVTLTGHGASWVYMLIDVHDETGAHVAFHGTWRNLTVLSGPTFDPLTVTVDGDPFVVSAEAEGDGLVQVSVSSATDPDTETETDIDPARRDRAIYAAGVQTGMLRGVFERPQVASLSGRDHEPARAAPPARVGPADPSSDALIRTFADSYARRMAGSGLVGRMTSGELTSPASVESLALAAADEAMAQYRSIEASWTALRGRIEVGGLLSFSEALSVHSQLSYVERVLAPAVSLGNAAAAARASASGWQDAGVRSMVAGLAEQASCGGGEEALRDALEAAGVAGVGALVELDAELRSAVPAFGLATDAALCAAAAVDADNSQLLEGLTIAGSETILSLLAPEPAEEPPPTHLRIIARFTDDGRVEHAVELAGGERILPERRFLPSDSHPDRWSLSSEVETDGAAIGRIRSRRLSDGRVELSFQPADGQPIAPQLRYLPSDAPTGTWLRSSQIEVPPPTLMVDGEW